MPAPPPDEDIERMQELYLEIGEYKAVADHEDVEWSRETVKKYCEDITPEDVEDPEFEDDLEETMPDHEEEESAFSTPAEEAAEAFRGFFRRLSEKHGFGLKDRAISMMSEEIERQGRLPLPQQVGTFLASGNTGLKNVQDILWVRDQYAQWLEGYLQIRNIQDADQGAIAGGGPGGMASQGGGVGSHSLTNDGIPVTGDQQQGSHGISPGGPGGGQSIGAGGQPQQPQQQQGQGLTDVLDELQELEEKKKQLQQTLGVGGPSEEVQALQAQIERLERKLDTGGPSHSEFPETASPAMQVAWLVENTDMDADEAERFIDDNKDPEVLKWEQEKREFEDRNQLIENLGNRLFDTIEEVAGNWDERVADGLYDKFTEGESEPRDSAPTRQQQQQRRQQAEPAATAPQGSSARQQAAPSGQSIEECPECDGRLLVGPDAEQCTDCGYGKAPCDECGEEVEIPPTGQSDWALCPETGCTEVLSAPEDPEEEVRCEGCGWEGAAVETGIEFVECEGCGDHRPIARDTQQRQKIGRLEL